MRWRYLPPRSRRLCVFGGWDTRIIFSFPLLSPFSFFSVCRAYIIQYGVHALFRIGQTRLEFEHKNNIATHFSARPRDTKKQTRGSREEDEREDQEIVWSDTSFALTP